MWFADRSGRANTFRKSMGRIRPRDLDAQGKTGFRGKIATFPDFRVARPLQSDGFPVWIQ